MSINKLILIRGLPGSGKTTLAKQLASDLDAKHFEADMYFETKSGEYHFNPQQLPQAHEWCFRQARKWLNQGKTVIVSNTFVRHWEMDRYLELCKKKGVEVEIRVCDGEYQSIHNVPLATIEKMRHQWQD
ncbi:ATP-binding protein [Vibrio sp. STUT-A11]|uniref:ATP-binding protein n=1 Tax=Vibrio sp. STUT-A11 TaxID=2976236 RepID=UPI002231AD17|nr:ATP-binding protein [Vibrio sp. STUT-A11]BDR13545.1 shikimate kinase [Vibrio sp. STUT-A11]